MIIGINYHLDYSQFSCQNLCCFKKSKIKIFLVTIHIFLLCFSKIMIIFATLN